MCVELYRLDRGIRRTLLVGDTRHEVGVVRRLWKATATDMHHGRGETLEGLADEQAGRSVETPRAVIVGAAVDYELDGRSVLGRRVLGWDAVRLVTQDLDWEHLRWAGPWTTGAAGRCFMRSGTVSWSPSASRAGGNSAFLEPNFDRLAEHRSPTIAECRSVRRLSSSRFEADCRLDDGRKVVVVGEGEGGELPDVGWSERSPPPGARAPPSYRAV